MQQRLPCPLEVCRHHLRCNSNLDRLLPQGYNLRSLRPQRLQLLPHCLESVHLLHTISAMTTVPATVACLPPTTSRTSATLLPRTPMATRRARCPRLNPSSQPTIPRHMLLSVDIRSTRKGSNSRLPNPLTSNKFRRHPKSKHLPNTSLQYSNRSNKRRRQSPCRSLRSASPHLQRTHKAPVNASVWITSTSSLYSERVTSVRSCWQRPRLPSHCTPSRSSRKNSSSRTTKLSRLDRRSACSSLPTKRSTPS